MEIENHKEEVPFAHYEGLFRELDPREVTARVTDVTFEEGAFRVTLLGRTFAISHPDCVFTALDGGSLPPLPTRTFLLRYLLESKTLPFGGSWKTFREMPWGEMYIKPYTGRVLTRAAFTFGTRVNAFRAAAQKLGATALSHGDAGFQFDLIGPYRMQILVWEGDDEFPPNAQILFSDNFPQAFSAEDRTVVGDLFITDLKRKM